MSLCQTLLSVEFTVNQSEFSRIFRGFRGLGCRPSIIPQLPFQCVVGTDRRLRLLLFCVFANFSVRGLDHFLIREDKLVALLLFQINMKCVKF